MSQTATQSKAVSSGLVGGRGKVGGVARGKVGCKRSPPTPRNGSVLAFLLHSVIGHRSSAESSCGRLGLSADMVKDSEHKVRCLDSYAPVVGGLLVVHIP